MPADLPPAKTYPPGSAAAKLLDAAVAVFAREGISSATTREIAREAGVNEVTLFRNFQTKQGLLAAVLEKAFLPADVDAAGEKSTPRVTDAKTLAKVLRDFAEDDFARKRRNIALMRVLIGESHRLGEHEKEVVCRILKPWKERLAGRLEDAGKAGLLRPGVDPVIVVDQLVAMIFVGALRIEKGAAEYPPAKYLDACVDLILHGILATKPRKAGGKP